jgi:transcriptional regulator with XRE-family HTH domain
MLSQIKSYLNEKLRDRSYRHKFFKGRAEDEVASQLIAFRKKRRLSQTALARLCGMKQSAVSRIEKSTYSRWNFTTLWRVAKALDVRVQVRFTDMADVIAEYERRECGGLSPTIITNEVTLDTMPVPGQSEANVAQWQLSQNLGAIHKTSQRQAADSSLANVVSR